ncbi:MAG: DUF1572 family protein [Phycisphaerales bacterium]|nr:DUF1572 family protein [Phycisphaerales bacterium]
MPRPVIDSFAAEFRRYRSMAEKAAAQLSWDELRQSLDAETNSPAVIMKHLGGNLRSRWTDPFTTDGEKPWRNRDREFIDDFNSRDELNAVWESGWAALESFLISVSDQDLPRTLLIRNEPHTLALAIARSCTHAAYHAGQIVQVARILASRAGRSWNTLTIPRGGSAAFNASKGLPQ